MQGWRTSMEDAHSTYLTLSSDANASFFAVFDGHGGHQVARYLKENLHKDIQKQSQYFQRNYSEALRRAFLECDWRMQTSRILPTDYVGSTAVTVLLKENTLYCANAGDSRAVACINGHPLALSDDHKPSNPDERKRIKTAGSRVCNDRVESILAVSRGFGDFHLKSNPNRRQEYQAVTAYPDICVKEITEDLEFIVLACDGIWEVKSSSEVVRFVRDKIAKRVHIDKICEALMDACVAREFVGEIGFDNMTVIIVCFLHGRPYEQFVQKCAQEQPANPQTMLTHIEIGPPETNESRKRKPKSQRRWGLNCFSTDAVASCSDKPGTPFPLPPVPTAPQHLIRPILSGRRATVPDEALQATISRGVRGSSLRRHSELERIDESPTKSKTISKPNLTEIQKMLKERSKTTGKAYNKLV